MDKSILNIAGIIAVVLGILCCLTVVGAIVGIPVIIGGIKLREYSNMTIEEIKMQKENLLIWTIVMLLLCTLSGVLCLIFYISLDNQSLFTSTKTNSYYDDLERINKLYKDKVLTKEEYEAEKARILNSRHS